MGAVANIDWIAILAGLLGPRRIVIALIDDVVGGLVEGFFRIVRRDKPSNAAGEANVGGGLPVLLQFGDITVVHFARGVGRGEAVTVARGAAQGRRREAADPNRRMRFLDRLGRELDLVDLEEFALEGERSPSSSLRMMSSASLVRPPRSLKGTAKPSNSSTL